MNTGLSAIARFREFPRYCTSAARWAVLSVVRSHPPLSTKDIFNLAQPVSQRRVNPSGTTRGVPPPNPTGPLRSIRYLKKVVLPHLAKERKLEKFHTKVATKDSHNTDAWLWRIIPEKPKQVAPDASTDALPAGIADLPPSAVGVGEDWGHLNKRRQRARERKVKRDLKLMTSIQDAKKEAARQVLDEMP